MTLILSLLLIIVQWLKITYQTQCEPLSLGLSMSALICLLLPVSALDANQTGLLPTARAHFTLFHHSPLTNDLPRFSPPQIFSLNPVHFHSLF